MTDDAKYPQAGQSTYPDGKTAEDIRKGDAMTTPEYQQARAIVDEHRDDRSGGSYQRLVDAIASALIAARADGMREAAGMARQSSNIASVDDMCPGERAAYGEDGGKLRCGSHARWMMKKGVW